MATTEEDLQPQGFAQLLDPQAAAAPPPQQEGPGFAGILSGVGDSVSKGWETAKSWAAEDPKKAMMLFHVFNTLAQNGTGSRAGQVGKALGAGAMYMSAQDEANQAKARRDQEFEQKTKVENHKLGSEDQRLGLEGQRVGLEGQRVGISQQQADQQGKNIDSEIAARGVNSEATQTATEQSKDSYGLKKQALAKKLQQLEIQMQGELTDNQRKALDVKMAKVKLEDAQLEHTRSVKFGEDERILDLQAKGEKGNAARATTKHLNAQTEGEEIKNNALKQLTPEQILGHAKTGQTPEERWSKYISDRQRANAMSVRPEQIDLMAEMEKFMAVEKAMAARRSGAAPAAPSTLPVDPKTSVVRVKPEEQQAWKSARDSVAIGQPYKGPDGQTYIRKN